MCVGRRWPLSAGFARLWFGGESAGEVRSVLYAVEEELWRV